jgi:hypothetical protein
MINSNPHQPLVDRACVQILSTLSPSRRDGADVLLDRLSLP